MLGLNVWDMKEQYNTQIPKMYQNTDAMMKKFNNLAN